MNLIESIVNNGHGYLNPRYLFIHETANPGATAKNHRDLYSRGYANAVHYVCDWTGDVYHCMYDNHLAWAVGNGNPYGVSIEICHATNASDFQKTWDTAVTFAAWYLKQRGWGIDQMMSHDECRLKWGGTTHTDPTGYFRKYGKSWGEFKNAVADAMVPKKIEEKKKVVNVIPIVTAGGTIYRYYNENTGAHLLCYKGEADTLKAPWKSEGKAFTIKAGGTVPVWRLRNPNNGTYMYTSSYKEAKVLEEAGWTAEQVAFMAQKSGTPVYRLYNPNSGDHHFTTSTTERDSLKKSGWKDEGVAFYV